MKAAQWDPVSHGHRDFQKVTDTSEKTQKKIVVNKLPVPEPRENQFLVKMASASLCHSDLMAIEAPRTDPVTIGHEGVGFVTKLHPSTVGKGFKEEMQ